jgi:hypothetical protein
VWEGEKVSDGVLPRQTGGFSDRSARAESGIRIAFSATSSASVPAGKTHGEPGLKTAFKEAKKKEAARKNKKK